MLRVGFDAVLWLVRSPGQETRKPKKKKKKKVERDSTGLTRKKRKCFFIPLRNPEGNALKKDVFSLTNQGL